MPLLQILEVLVVVGVLLWLVNRFIPMQGSIKSILNGVVVIAVVLWLLNVFRTLSLAVPDARRNVADPVGESAITLKRVTKSIHSQCGSHLPQGVTLKTKLLLAVGITLSLERICSNQFSNHADRRTHELDAHVPGDRHQPQCAGGQL